MTSPVRFPPLLATEVSRGREKLTEEKEAEADQILHAQSVWKEGTLREKLTIIRACAALGVNPQKEGTPGSSRDASRNGFLQN